MLSLKFDNERLQQLIQQKGINPSAVLKQQTASSSSEHRLSLGDPAGLGTYYTSPVSKWVSNVIAHYIYISNVLKVLIAWEEVCL